MPPTQQSAPRPSSSQKTGPTPGPTTGASFGIGLVLIALGLLAVALVPKPEIYGSGLLLTIAAAAVAVLLLLIMKMKLHPVIALVLVSLGTALATGITMTEVLDVLLDGFGSTLGEVGLLLAFGVMFARLFETSGGAAALSSAMIDRLGEKRAPFALGVASLMFGFPIFFDAAFMVMLPILLATARRLGGSVLIYVLPAAAALSTMHVLLPPHPGVVAATVLLGADVGLVVLVGLVVAIPSWYISGYLYGMWIGKRIDLPVPELVTGGPQVDDVEPPRVRVLVGLLALPLVLIFMNTLVTTLGRTGTIDPDATWAAGLVLLGSTPIALLITVLASCWVIGVRRGNAPEVIEDMLDNALKPIAPVMLITGAGGMFGGVLLASGIGDALSGTLQDTGLPLVAAVFVVAAIVRVALGTATVAITTAAGLLGASVAAAGLSPLQTAALTIVLAGGSSVLSHVNDASFWLIGRLLGMSVPQTFKTWTVIKTLIGCVAAALGTVIYLIA
ncbi:MAG: GntP family permease [Corynebacterium sp.]|uniref:GntP family permease n=1 Tax=unclassified Corynebacterium TaxID=2624378 RepID=UPI0026480329|nr:GntP family permease [Corynebacterium sp.]MDN5581805.1 GntP family permease [Corynebacterium sp.]MDN5719175.1 GntP family permease [Corynebacterium sp.]MDN6258157.1 GntP family permease [Corynebacterium sp.]MDN6323951.1 GntP family permease [Corynebacterium sp.]